MLLSPYIFEGKMFLKEIYKNGVIDSTTVWVLLLQGHERIVGQVVDIMLDIHGHPLMISMLTGEKRSVIDIPWNSIIHIRRL